MSIFRKIDIYSTKGHNPLFLYEQDTPDIGAVTASLSKLFIIDRRMLKIPKSYVVREYDYLIEWITGKIKIDKIKLDDGFKSNIHSYSTEIFVVNDIIFNYRTKLMSKGLDGYTSYSCIVVKVGDDDFMCIE